MKQKNMRKKFYQKGIYLNRSIFLFFIFSGAGAAVLSALFVFFSSVLLSLMINQGNIQSAISPVTLFGQILVNYWLYIFAGSMLFILIATLFTHRFSGPLTRFEMSLDRMINNNIGFEIKLRKNDENKSLANKFNLFNAWLSSTIQDLRFLSDKVDKHHVMLQKTDLSKDDTLQQAIVLNQKMKQILFAFKCE
jgi:methyl-accepting chemotaxis protein